MHDRHLLVIPQSWIEEASTDFGGRSRLKPFFEAVPIAGYETLSKARLRNLITKTLRRAGGAVAAVVLPKSFARGKRVRYWPDLLIPTPAGMLVTSVLFADSWTECRAILARAARDEQPVRHNHHVTCQYQPPYTDMLRLWAGAGAQPLHPGDYFKPEFLQELSNMRGHWLYWGHADGESLHGYDRLSAADIVQYKPMESLRSTLWFSCATLDTQREATIALDWYLSGATDCLLASTAPIDTADNQRLGRAWLDAIKMPGVASIADVLQYLAADEQEGLAPVLAEYRLLGVGWGEASAVGVPEAGQRKLRLS